MNNPLAFYNQQKTELEQHALKLKSKLIKLGVLRFVVFLTTCFFMYITFGAYLNLFIVTFLGISLFSFLVFTYINIKRKKAIVDTKININKTEIDVLGRKFHHLETGNEFIDSTHFYSNDIDLFGKGSFFQFINRTTTNDGKIKLAKTLTENNIEEILDKQEVIKELSEEVKWRQHFAALARLVSVKKSSAFTVHWITNYKAILPKFSNTIQLGFSIISILLIVFISFGFVSFAYLIIWFFMGIFVASRFIKKTSQIYTEIDKVSDTFKQYHQLLNEIEHKVFKAKILKEKQKIINSEDKKASEIFKEISKILNTFDQRNNDVIAILGNGLFLFEVYNAYKVEKWLLKYNQTVKKWFEVVAFFDAQNSLANFKFNHPDYIFPELNTEKEIIKSSQLGHPLLPIDKRIDNDFIINDSQFFIITGANMAGKSTFLRTVSLSVVMANCGLPVCAKSFLYKPIKLITSMRTSDSLSEDESYFYSELKRLKYIVDAIKTEKYFIILDEILKGTNSKDKATGSKRFVEKLTKSKSTGIIATHDVSLCELEYEFSTIKNYYFDAEIISNELYFDYALKNGVCKNMNASFLLQKMEIV